MAIPGELLAGRYRLVNRVATDPAARPAMTTVARLLTDLQCHGSAAADPHPPTLAPPQTIAVPPRTVREWPTDPDQDVPALTATPAVGAPLSAPAGEHHQRRLRVILTAAMVLLLAGLGTWALVGRNGNTQPSAANKSANITQSATHSPESAATTHHSAPSTTAPAAAPSLGTISAPLRPIPVAPSTTSRSASPTAATARPSTSRRPIPTTPPTTRTTPSSSPSATVQSVPTASQLAAAITDYYASLPGNTDQGWVHLTSNFQNGTAQNRQYYQHFWDGVQSVTATNAHGASPDTAEATITYRFKDGRTAVEPTVYSLVQQGGILKIDTSTVLSSTTQ